MTNPHIKMTRKPSAAKMLQRAVDRRRSIPLPRPSIEDDFEQSIAAKLESRGITTVPGLRDEPQWYDLAIEQHRRDQEIEAAREAQRQAEEAAKIPPRSAASSLMEAIAKQANSSASGSMPLNGASVLRAALAGSPGTINGGSR